MRILVSVALVGVFAAPAFAQNPRLVALVNDPLTAVPAEVIQTAQGNCGVALRCTPAGFPAPVHPTAGGTAHDPRTSGTWISNGNVLAKVDPETCTYQCVPINVPLPANAFITGLAFRESHDTLLMTDSLGGMTRVEVTPDCGFGIFDRCPIQTPLPVLSTFAGLAIDEESGAVFYSASNFFGGAIVQTVFVARFNNPCVPVCNVSIGNCVGAMSPFGGITGLAFDPCSNRLYATDGDSIVSGHFLHNNFVGCQLVNITCCPSISQNPPALSSLRGAIGLCIRPKGAESHGQGCSNGSCGNCNNAAVRLVGDPVIGNLDFRVRMTGLSMNGPAWLGFGVGACQLPGVPVPNFCGTLKLPLFPADPLFLGPMNPIGTPQNCSGVVVVPVPIPADSSLCGGFPFSIQGLQICFQSFPLGTTMTNCLDLTIGGT